MAISLPPFAILLVIVLAILLVTVFFIVPALARVAVADARPDPDDWRQRVLLRYQGLSSTQGFNAISATFPLIFARFKLRLDPMFRELPEFLKSVPKIRSVLDIGCGFGIAGCALLEWRPELTVFGIDPNAARIRAARAAFADRGRAFVALAPEFENPLLPDKFDAVLVLDVIHFLSDPQLDLTLGKIRAKMEPDARLIIRAIVPPVGAGSWPWKFAKLRRALTAARACHRSVETIRGTLARCGFETQTTEISGGNPELSWFIATASRGEPAAPLPE